MEFNNYNITMKKEFISLIGYFTHFKYGIKLLKKHEIFRYLERLVKLQKYDHYIVVILLSSNFFEFAPAVSLITYIFLYGSDYLKKIALNIIQFLLNSENYNFIYKNFIFIKYFTSG